MEHGGRLAGGLDANTQVSWEDYRERAPRSASAKRVSRTGWDMSWYSDG
jgi:hypothetical protein